MSIGALVLVYVVSGFGCWWLAKQRGFQRPDEAFMWVLLFGPLALLGYLFLKPKAKPGPSHNILWASRSPCPNCGYPPGSDLVCQRCGAPLIPARPDA